ncbi:hypothetical protein ACXYTP_25300 [Tsukamurella ocularis]
MMGILLLAGWALFAVALGWLAVERPTGTGLDVLSRNDETREDER